MQFLQLLLVNFRRRVVHERHRAGRFRECNHVANRFFAREQHANPIEAERNAAVRRRALAKRFEHETEFLLRLFLIDAKKIEYLAL